MKMRHLVVATTAAVISFGAVAGGQQQSRQEDRTAPQAETDISLLREAQNALRARGHPATPQGVQEFQHAKGLEPSGRLDEQTLAALGVGASAPSGASAPQSGEQSKH